MNGPLSPHSHFYSSSNLNTNHFHFQQISYRTLCSILEYVYSGEVLVTKENLNEFIDAGKALHIKGLEEMVCQIFISYFLLEWFTLWYLIFIYTLVGYLYFVLLFKVLKIKPHLHLLFERIIFKSSRHRI